MPAAQQLAQHDGGPQMEMVADRDLVALLPKESKAVHWDEPYRCEKTGAPLFCPKSMAPNPRGYCWWLGTEWAAKKASCAFRNIVDDLSVHNVQMKCTLLHTWAQKRLSVGLAKDSSKKWRDQAFGLARYLQLAVVTRCLLNGGTALRTLLARASALTVGAYGGHFTLTFDCSTARKWHSYGAALFYNDKRKWPLPGDPEHSFEDTLVCPLPLQHGGHTKYFNGDTLEGCSDTAADPRIGESEIQTPGADVEATGDDGNAKSEDKAASAYSAAGILYVQNYSFGRAGADEFRRRNYVPQETAVKDVDAQGLLSEEGLDMDQQMHVVSDQGSSEWRCVQLLQTIFAFVFRYGPAHRLWNNVKGLDKTLHSCSSMWTSFLSGPRGEGGNTSAFREALRELQQLVKTQPARAWMSFPHVKDIQAWAGTESLEEALDKAFNIKRGSDSRWFSDDDFAEVFMEDGPKLLAVLAHMHSHSKQQGVKLQVGEVRDPKAEFDGKDFKSPKGWIGYAGEMYQLASGISQEKCVDYRAATQSHREYYYLLELLDATPSTQPAFRGKEDKADNANLSTMIKLLDPQATPDSCYSTPQLQQLFSKRRIEIWKSVAFDVLQAASANANRLHMSTVLLQRVASVALFDLADPNFGLWESIAHGRFGVDSSGAARHAELYSRPLPVNAKRLLRVILLLDEDDDVDDDEDDAEEKLTAAEIVERFVSKVCDSLPLFEKLTESQFKSFNIYAGAPEVCPCLLLDNKDRPPLHNDMGDVKASDLGSFWSKNVDRVRHFASQPRHKLPPPLAYEEMKGPLLPHELDDILDMAVQHGHCAKDIHFNLDKQAKIRERGKHKEAQLTKLYHAAKSGHNKLYHNLRAKPPAEYEDDGFGGLQVKEPPPLTLEQKALKCVAEGPAQSQPATVGFRGAEAQALYSDPGFEDCETVTPDMLVYVRSVGKRMTSQRQLVRRLKKDPHLVILIRCRKTHAIYRLTGLNSEGIFHAMALPGRKGGGWIGYGVTADAVQFKGGYIGMNFLYDGEFDLRHGPAYKFGLEIRPRNDRWIDPDQFGRQLLPQFSKAARMGAMEWVVGKKLADTCRNMLAELDDGNFYGIYDALSLKYSTPNQHALYLKNFKAISTSARGGVGFLAEMEAVMRARNLANSKAMKTGPTGKQSKERADDGQRMAPEFVFVLHRVVQKSTGKKTPKNMSAKERQTALVPVAEFRSHRTGSGSGPTKFRIDWLKHRPKRALMFPTCEVDSKAPHKAAMLELAPYVVQEFGLCEETAALTSEDGATCWPIPREQSESGIGKCGGATSSALLPGDPGTTLLDLARRGSLGFGNSCAASSSMVNAAVGGGSTTTRRRGRNKNAGLLDAQLQLAEPFQLDCDGDVEMLGTNGANQESDSEERRARGLHRARRARRGTEKTVEELLAEEDDYPQEPDHGGLLVGSARPQYEKSLLTFKSPSRNNLERKQVSSEASQFDEGLLSRSTKKKFDIAKAKAALKPVKMKKANQEPKPSSKNNKVNPGASSSSSTSSKKKTDVSKKPNEKHRTRC
eukprot:g6679.t1